MRSLFLALLACVCAFSADQGLGPVPTNTTLTAPGPVGSTTPNTGAFTTLTTTTTATLGADAGSGESVNINAAAATERSLWWRTASLGRWKLYADNVAESGSDAGSSLILAARNDAGSNLGAVLTITRAAGGPAAFSRPTTVPAFGVGATTTATAAGTTVLTSTSTCAQIFTGSTTQTVTLPAANALGSGIGQVFMFKNNSTGAVTIQRAGSDTINSTASNVTSFTLAQWAACTLYSDGVSAWERF